MLLTGCLQRCAVDCYADMVSTEAIHCSVVTECCHLPSCQPCPVAADALLCCLLLPAALQVRVPRKGSAAAAAAAAQGFASRRRVGLRMLPEASPFPGASLEAAVATLRGVQGRGMGADGLPLDFTFSLLRVVRSQELQAQGSGRSTKHVELALPQGMAYTAGGVNGSHASCILLAYVSLGSSAVRAATAWLSKAAQCLTCFLAGWLAAG